MDKDRDRLTHPENTHGHKVLRQRQVRQVVLLLLIFAQFACNGRRQGYQDEVSDAVTAGGITHAIGSLDEAERAAISALKGDPSAASNLVLYFLEKKDERRAARWEAVAIQNRSPSSLLTRGNELIISANPCEVLRGIYFIELALASDAEQIQGQANEWRKELDFARKRAEQIQPGKCLMDVPESISIAQSH